MKATSNSIAQQNKQGSRKSIRVNDIEVNLDELDMNRLTHD